jgi:hypothetical protein
MIINDILNNFFEEINEKEPSHFKEGKFNEISIDLENSPSLYCCNTMRCIDYEDANGIGK